MPRNLFFLLVILSQSVSAQLHLGVYAGTSNYLGELNYKPFARAKLAGGISLNYEVSDRLMIRGGFTAGKLEAGDQWSGTSFLKENRNLSFQSSLTEGSLVAEVTLFNLYNINWSPYAFAGVAVYHFNPYVIDSNKKIYLQPLSTEGQGIAGSGVSPYSLTQLAIPVGGGIKFNLSDNVRLGIEVGLRKLFTDYLDDVSGSYFDAATLLAARGPKAVQLAYRGDEVPGEANGFPDSGFPTKGSFRGNPNWKDWYYFTGVHLTFRLGTGEGKSYTGGRRSNYGCPSVL